MNESFKAAMMAALPSPANVATGAPQQQQQQANSADGSGSPIALGIEALSGKKSDANQDEIAEKQKKYDGLRPLN